MKAGFSSRYHRRELCGSLELRTLNTKPCSPKPLRETSKLAKALPIAAKSMARAGPLSLRRPSTNSSRISLWGFTARRHRNLGAEFRAFRGLGHGRSKTHRMHPQISSASMSPLPSSSKSENLTSSIAGFCCSAQVSVESNLNSKS